MAFSGSGNGAATANLGNAGKILSVEVVNGGSGYTGPTLTFDPPAQQSFTGGSTIVDTTTNTINIDNHTFETGDEMTYDATTLDATAVAIGGLTSGTTYYAIYVDANNIKVASSLSNANAGTAESLTSAGSGSQFFQGCLLYTSDAADDP